MKRIFILFLLTFPTTIFSLAQSKHKVVYTIKDCDYSTNNKDYKPCLGNFKNDFVILDLDKDEWIFHTRKTIIYQILKIERLQTDYSDLKKVVFQVLDDKNEASVFALVYSTNTEGIKLNILLHIEGKQTMRYDLDLFNVIQ